MHNMQQMHADDEGSWQDRLRRPGFWRLSAALQRSEGERGSVRERAGWKEVMAMNSKPDQANNRVGKIIESGLVAFETRSLGPVAPGKVRIRVVSSAICGSDLHIFKGKHPSVKLPTAIGHEFSGEIVEIGPDVQGLSLGERVTLEPVIACGTARTSASHTAKVTARWPIPSMPWLPAYSSCPTR